MCFRSGTVLLLAAFGIVNSLSCLNNVTVGQWIQGENGFLPSGSVYAGFQDKSHVNLYICRIGDIVGKYYEPTKSCYVSDKNAKEQISRQYEILADVGHVVWVPVYNKQLPCNLVQTGGTKTGSTYAGRTWMPNGFLIPGNIVDGVNFVAWASDVKSETYEALTSVPRSIALSYRRSTNIYGTIVKYFIFKVKSEGEVYVDFGVNTEIRYRLTIGAFNNKVSGIGPKNDPFQSYEKTQNIMSSSSLKGFWVRWTLGDTIEFGEEGVVKPAVKFSDDKIHDLNSVVLTSSDKDSSWQIADLTKFDGKEFVGHHRRHHPRHVRVEEIAN